MLKKNGEVMDLLVSAVAQRSAAAKATHKLSFMVDVTDRKREEQARQESERLNRVTMGSAAHGIVVVNGDDHTVPVKAQTSG